MQPLRTWPKGKESPHHDASPGGVSKFATDYMFMGEDGTPITILAGDDGKARAFFVNVVPFEGHESRLRRKKRLHKTCCPQVIRK